MDNAIAQLPFSTHAGIIRQLIEREKNVRRRNPRGNPGSKIGSAQEAEEALQSLAAMEAMYSSAVRQDKDDEA